MMNEMKGELEKAGCIDKVEFVGQIPHEKIPDYLNEMKFHILPSYTEAWSSVNVEAMACGTVAIANSVGGVPDIMRDNKTGFLLRDNKPQTIADKLIEIWDRPDISVIQRNALDFVQQNFSYEKAVKDWKHILTSTCP
jgi:glycosyltransferase involved in cell wall biosynthesis